MSSSLNYDHEGFIPGPLQPRVVDKHWLLASGRFEDYRIEGPSLLEHGGMSDAYVAINGIADQIVDNSLYRSF